MSAGDIITIIISAALLIVTGAAAVATIVQARVAVAARSDAESARGDAQTARDEAQSIAKEATDAFKRQAAALEKSNELKEAESRPPAWTGPLHVGGQTYVMTNSSLRTIRVDHISVKPEETDGRVLRDGVDGKVFEYGDSFDFLVVRVMGPRPRTMTIFWHYVDEPADEFNEWIVAL